MARRPLARVSPKSDLVSLQGGGRHARPLGVPRLTPVPPDVYIELRMPATPPHERIARAFGHWVKRQGRAAVVFRTDEEIVARTVTADPERTR